MDFKEDTIRVLDIIKSKTGLTQKEISVQMGYDETYISTILNRGGTRKFLTALKLHFQKEMAPGADDLGNLNATVKNLYRPLPLNLKPAPVAGFPLWVWVAAQTHYAKQHKTTQTNLEML